MDSGWRVRAGEHRHHDFVLTRTHIHDRARTAQHNTTQGDTLRNVVRGLMYMVSGKASGTEALRLLAQVSSRAVGFRVDDFIF